MFQVKHHTRKLFLFACDELHMRFVIGHSRQVYNDNLINDNLHDNGTNKSCSKRRRFFTVIFRQFSLLKDIYREFVFPFSISGQIFARVGSPTLIPSPLYRDHASIQTHSRISSVLINRVCVWVIFKAF